MIARDLPPEAASGDLGRDACLPPRGEPLPAPWPRMSEAERAAWLARNLTDEARAAGERAQREAEANESAAGHLADLGRNRRQGGWAQLLSAAESVRWSLLEELRGISRGPRLEADEAALGAASLSELHGAAHDLQAWVARRRGAEADAEAAAAARAEAWDAAAPARAADLRAGFEAGAAGAEVPRGEWVPARGAGSFAWLRGYEVGAALGAAPKTARKRAAK